MKLGMSLQTSLHQSLTPQQIQYLKMLQLPMLQLEQHVRAEMENNPMLEDGGDGEHYTNDIGTPDTETSYELPRRDVVVAHDMPGTEGMPPMAGSENISIDDNQDAFEFYKLIWGEDPSSSRASDYVHDDDEEFGDGGFQVKDQPSFEEELLEQIRYLPIRIEERLLGEYIIGNVDDDGYLRRPIQEILDELNSVIAEHNLAIQAPSLLGGRSNNYAQSLIPDVDVVLDKLNLQDLERMLHVVQSLDPPGFASRSVQECLVAQLRSRKKLNAAQKLALLILTQAYEPFAMKHYATIEKNLGVTEDYLREALDVIRHLNPRPGGGTFGQEMNTVIPDFVIERDKELDDFTVTVSDSRLPTLRVSSAYEKLKKEAKNHKFNKDTREWLRKKHEDAKFLIQAIRQRKSTMLKVMTAIVGLQTDFFRYGPHALKPLIYRDVAELTGMDISTICRIVNGKYALTEYGTFELKYFFSESLLSDDGEEISTRVIKTKIKEMIDGESKHKPLSDDKLAKDLKIFGYNVARRTVAKYREQLRIPVARLRKEL